MSRVIDPLDERAENIADLFARPPPRYDELFDEPNVRWRIGEQISQALNGPNRVRRKRSVAPSISQRLRSRE
jgi:hypothetical protein